MVTESEQVTEARIASAISIGTAALQAFNSAIEQLSKLSGPNGETFSLDIALPGLAGNLTAANVGDRVNATIALLQTLAAIKNSVLIPDSDIADLVSRSGEVKTVIENLASAVTTFINAQPLAGIDINAFTGTNAASQTYNFGSLIGAVYGPSQTLLAVARRLLVDRDRPAMPDLAGALAALSSVRADQLSEYKSLVRLKRHLESLDAAAKPILTAMEQSARDADNARAEAQGIRNDAETLREGITSAQLQATSDAAIINSVKDKAQLLEQAVNAYDASFQLFDTELEARKQLFAEGTKQYNEMIKHNTRSTEELSGLVERARAVLGEATVSGLSGKFAAEAKGINSRLRFALFLLFVGIILFLISAGVVLDLFPWLSSLGLIQVHFREPPTDPTLWPNLVYLISSVIGKLVFLLPSAFLIGFSAKWYAALFKLRQDYAHKFTVAASIPGFKIESPEFAEVITAVAFQELMQKSEEHDDQTLASPNEKKNGGSLVEKLLNPLITKIVNKVLTQIETKKS